MKRLLLYLVVTALVAAMVVGCAPAAPTPTPARTPTPTLTPSPTPKPHEIVELEVLSLRSGTTTYQLSFALAEIVTKNHPWLRVTAQEGIGSAPNQRVLAEQPEKRKNTLVYTQDLTIDMARLALTPFKAPYKGARVIGAMSQSVATFCTKDKSITTPQDLVGKRVMLAEAGSPTNLLWGVMEEAYGIKGKVTISTGPPDAQVNALKDGLIDGFWGGFGAICSPGGRPPFAVSPALLEYLTARPDTGFLNLTAQDMALGKEKTGINFFLTIMPPGTLDKFGIPQPEPVPGQSASMLWVCDESMNEEVVYELTKMIYENSEKFAEIAGPAGQTVTKETLAITVSPDLFHPGALRFYREKGIEVGMK